MKTLKIIGIILIIVAVLVAIFGVWLKLYNDKLAEARLSEEGSCYLPDGTCIHATSDTILYISFGIAIFITVVGVYLIIKKESQKIIVKKIIKTEKIISEPVKKIEAPSSLSPETKNIFNIISESGGAILQGELVTKSGLDKVKVSRILDKLEMHGLIERRRHGMSNMVVLKNR